MQATRPACPRRGRPRRATFALAIAIAGWLVPACSDDAEMSQRPTTPTVEPEAPPDEPALDEELRPDALRALGYVAAKRAAPPAPEAGAAALSTEALSELDYQMARSRSQRANEAFEYLGLPGREANAESFADKRAPRSIAGPRRYIDFDRLSGERHEVSDFRDRNAAVAPGGKEAIAAPDDEKAEVARSDSPSAPPALSPAQRFLRERRALEDLRFQPASGYWANSYVPGDPVMRWLEARLGERDRSALQAFAARPLLLDDAARQTPQPFDPPHSAALSVFLQADRRGLEGEGRMLVQVGLQGAYRRSGLRPAMSVGIVLDWRGAVSPEVAAAMRALVDGFLAAKDVGDRFSLTVVGRPGGTVVGADAFRHGPIAVAMRRLVAPAGSDASGGPVLGLDEAVRATATRLQRSEDPAAPLGSSLVLLVTSQPLGHHTEALASIAHRSAVAGVPVSVVGIGEAVDLAAIERVTLAGQGNRRLMHTAAEAEGLAERELSSLARVIARAVRLRIRLAPGVRLVEVVDADRLDATGAQQVREAEKSIDRRLARNLGIEADRGEDEEGIQIVIPAFHSRDAHAVLLDVVAPGPGPIADVTVRYKDLVYLRNSVARDHLSLGRSADPPGPLERNVVKNYLAIRLASALKDAGRALLTGGDDRAIARIREFRALLESLRREVPGFQNDTDLANDAGMLGEYLALLDGSALDRIDNRQYLADSLQLAGYFKTVPRDDADRRGRRR
jgi:hypothetical protein